MEERLMGETEAGRREREREWRQARKGEGIKKKKKVGEVQER